jgi:hypothetical protein
LTGTGDACQFSEDRSSRLQHNGLHCPGNADAYFGEFHSSSIP